MVRVVVTDEFCVCLFARRLGGALGFCMMQLVSVAGDIGGQAGIVVRVVVTDEFCVCLFARLMGAPWVA